MNEIARYILMSQVSHHLQLQTRAGLHHLSRRGAQPRHRLGHGLHRLHAAAAALLFRGRLQHRNRGQAAPGVKYTSSENSCAALLTLSPCARLVFS